MNGKKEMKSVHQGLDRRKVLATVFHRRSTTGIVDVGERLGDGTSGG